jgi:hypothetical protein
LEGVQIVDHTSQVVVIARIQKLRELGGVFGVGWGNDIVGHLEEDQIIVPKVVNGREAEEAGDGFDSLP